MHRIFGQFIALCWTIFFVYWFVAAFSAKRTAQGKGWSRWGWRFPILVAMFIVIVLNRGQVSMFFRAVLWRRTLAMAITADLVTLTGLILLIWARRTLAGNWSADVVIKQDHELIERGPYAYVRHPIYSGLFLMGLGTAIFFGTLDAFLAWILVFAGLWGKALQEERLLTRHFPEAYPPYRRRTGAFIPCRIGKAHSSRTVTS